MAVDYVTGTFKRRATYMVRTVPIGGAKPSLTAVLCSTDITTGLDIYLDNPIYSWIII